MKSKNNIGNNIKLLREINKLSMDDLCACLNKCGAKIDKSMISRWEAGINSPSLENAIFLAHFFHVSVDELAGATN